MKHFCEFARFVYNGSDDRKYQIELFFKQLMKLEKETISV